MQLMTFNSLLMFDIVFMFFLFLVGVTCLVYYLPTGRPHRPLVQAAESFLETEKCRYRHRHLQLLSLKNGHRDRISTDEASSEYEEDEEDDINDDESDIFEEIPKFQSKDHQQQKEDIEQQQHNYRKHNRNQNEKTCSDMKEKTFIERNEIELVKLHNKGYYPLPRQQKQQKQNRFKGCKENANKSNKILYHCCPPCNLSDCEHFYISYEEPNSLCKGNKNDIFNNSMIKTYRDANSIGTAINDTIRSSRSKYLNETIRLEKITDDDDDNDDVDDYVDDDIRNGTCNESRNLIGIDKFYENRKTNYNIDCNIISPSYKIKSRAIINNKRESQTTTAKTTIKKESNNKIQQPILSLPPSILSIIDEKTNVPDNAPYCNVNNIEVDNDCDKHDNNNDGDEVFHQYIDDEDDDCCSTTSVDIVLAEGIDADSSNLIIYDNKRKCQRKCKNRYIDNDIRTTKTITSNRKKYSKNKYYNYNNNSQNTPQKNSLNINAAASTLREHYYVVKETEKIKNGTGFCSNCNLVNYSSSSSSASSCNDSSLSSSSMVLSSAAAQVLQHCNNNSCPLLSSSSSSFNCTSFDASKLLNTTATSLISPTFIPSPPDSPLLSVQLPFKSSPSSGLRIPPSSPTNIPALAHQPYCCHVKAKSNDLKDCLGPIVDV